MRIEAGRFHGRSLPRPRGARPASGRLRRSLLGALAPWLPDARVLDLFAGAGTLGLEALSRGAAEVLLVERDREAAAALGRWIREAGAEGEARVLCRDAARGPLPAGPFDVVFLDPPFALWDGAGAAGLVARAVAALAPQGVLALKVPARQAVPEGPGWRLVRRRALGSVGWALIASSPAPEAPIQG